MATLKQKTLSGLFWSFIDTFAKQAIAFVVGIILARLLSPQEFGLVGMLAVFIAISTVLTQSGFNQALIRKKNCTNVDYSTVFWFNLAVSFCLYLILYFTAGHIARFYNEPQLEPLVRVLGLGILINALTMVQKTRLTKRIDFKLLAKITLISTSFSGLVGIGFAIAGFGVWSLVYKTLAANLFMAILLWKWNKWTPILKFSKKAFREMFSFGSRLMTLGIIDTIYNNAYLVIIGKYYSAMQLGFYTKADQFKKMPSQTITALIQRVSYPVLSTIQDETERLKAAYRRLIKSTMLITFLLMIGLAVIARDFTVLILGEEWALTGEYLQILCFAGLFYPLDALNSNILKVVGRADFILNIGILRKFMAVPVILAAIFWGIKPMLYLMVLHKLAGFWIISHYGGKFINYATWAQVKDILPGLFIAVAMAVFVFFIGVLLNIDMLYVVFIQIIGGALFSLIILEMIKLQDYLYLKELVLEKIAGIKKR